MPEEDIKVEVEGTNSYEELSAAALIVAPGRTRPRGRARLRPLPLAADLPDRRAGRADARTCRPTTRSSPLRSLARETAAVAVGRIIGYRRLSNLL